MAIDFDVLIVGGGLVGSALALALADADLHIGLIEARPLLANLDPDYNERSVALSEGSCRILRGLGVWDDLRRELMPIRSVHVSEKGRFGSTRLEAGHYGLDRLGCVALNRHLGEVFASRLHEQGNLTLLAPARLNAIVTDADSATVRIELNGEEQTLGTRLLVAADGTGSFVRDALGVSAHREDYGQVAVIANVTPGKDHQGIAYERFTPQGPVALLPLPERRCALVWTQSPEEAEQTMRLDDEAFMRALEAHFGYRLGRFEKTGVRQAFPLALWRAESMVAQRAVVIGNAAHTLHPIAGQGLNLALRDVADLTSLLVDGGALEPGDHEGLAMYEEMRKQDVDRVITYTDGLLRLFTQPSPLMGHIRGAGLAFVDRCPPLRRLMARQGMGLASSRSRLVRGLPAVRPGAVYNTRQGHGRPKGTAGEPA